MVDENAARPLYFFKHFLRNLVSQGIAVVGKSRTPLLTKPRTPLGLPRRPTVKAAMGWIFTTAPRSIFASSARRPPCCPRGSSIGHGADTGKTTRGCRRSATGNRLLIDEARFPQMGVQINKTSAD